MTELGGGDEPVLVLVEDPEGLLQLLLRVGVLHLPRHQVQKLWKVDRPLLGGDTACKKLLIGQQQPER
ncbi:unnamed protein product [Spirodela intermedia]|uniref:Uncharacterized protein n=1 Tax=Spirodela intermedia TaxID=51605 RepID=A0A7I8IH36_SPIIN|nr:unnamed protein product [Spirodela intermedia]CAA6657023.1 unnamed protein product [Spirodela intermedia]